MLITLAWPQEGLGGAGDTVDVDDATGVRLLGDGLARYPDPPTASMDPAEIPAAELDTAAAAEGIDLGDAHTAKQKRDVIASAREKG
jgi:hypothetical protein